MIGVMILVLIVLWYLVRNIPNDDDEQLIDVLKECPQFRFSEEGKLTEMKTSPRSAFFRRVYRYELGPKDGVADLGSYGLYRVGLSMMGKNYNNIHVV